MGEKTFTITSPHLGGDCVQCGYCCHQSVCTHGIWDETKHVCIYLTADNLCSKYEEIKDDDFSPAMGGGCCSSLNDVRKRRVNALLLKGRVKMECSFHK